MQETTIFALDIGTRSVVGIVGTMDEDRFTALDYEQRFHRHGAMRDGQIEDIRLVSKTVSEVKEALEERCGTPLTSASIAAAGRSLVTVQASYEQDLPDAPLDEEQIRSLEYGALSAAMESFEKDGSSGGYSCVGHSVTAYILDNYRYSNLEGHRGNHVKVDIIAAFLPFSVIRSLYAVTEECGLTVDSLTLEPIAAINAIVPADIRLLNIAIVDIGAGTSDIAVSKNGSIVAYDMITIAGDELTETIMKHYLTDFDTAEQIKKSLEEGQKDVIFSNILGLPVNTSREEILAATDSAADTLCKEACESILRINEHPPVAVFLVGGGSRFPGLCQRFANGLDLPEERVAIGGKQAYRNIDVRCEALLAPDFVTPLGIGAAYRYAKGKDFFSVTVNEQKIMLPDSGEMKVLDALLLAGIRAADLIGRTPASLTFTVNGTKRTIRASQSAPGEILVNGEPATLDTIIKQGDKVLVNFARDGVLPTITAGELQREFPGSILRINGSEATPDQEIASGDAVEIAEREPVAPRHPPLRICLNGRWLEVPPDENGVLQFVDMLNYVDLDPRNPQGELILKRNGRDISYTDLLADGDQVEIRWAGQDV